MNHPGSNELLEFHFREVDPTLEAEIGHHVESCAGCRAILQELDWIENGLAAGVDETPPADGLERVLAGVAPVPQTRIPSRLRVSAMAPSLVAIATGVVSIVQGGLMGAALFFIGGALVTLAMAPILIIESQRRVS